MIFIFDWGYRTNKNYGPLSRNDAPFGIDGEMVWLIREITWFRAFFIPLIPTKTSYFFQDLNSDEREIINFETFKQFRDLAVLNALAMDDQITDEEYDERRDKMGF